MRISTILVLFALAAAVPAAAADLYAHDPWPALAADRTAHQVGDVLTVAVYQSATAINSANSSGNKDSAFSGRASFGTGFDEGAALTLQGASDNQGSTGRSGGMVAQLTVTVDLVLPNGDLHVAGAQVLNINGEKTHIRVEGRVRPADISGTNTVLSNRLADAEIDYDGSGFVSRSAAPGLITRIFNWLGLP